MDLRTEIGQHLVSGFPGETISDEFISAVKEYRIGNVILFARNIHSKEQLSLLCRNIQSLIRENTGFDAMIFLDQEGGMVTRLSSDATNVPGQMAICATANLQNAHDCAYLTAKELRAMGVNCNLAPVLDVNENKDNPVIGVRSFSDLSKVVAQYGTSMFQGYEEGGVLSCAKHFPGHGDTNVDSHLSLPVVNKTREELQGQLYPFKQLIKAGIPAVMTSHILFPAYEEEAIPATISRKIINGLLRTELGFKRLVLSDCMEMQAIKDYYGTVPSCVRAIGATVDMVFLSHHVDQACLASQAIEQGLRDNVIDGSEFSSSTERIIKEKKVLAGIEPEDLSIVGSAAHKAISERVRNESLTIVQGKIPQLGEHPLFISTEAYRCTNVGNDATGFSFSKALASRFPGSLSAIITHEPTKAEIEQVLSLVPAATSIWFGTYNGHLFPGQLQLADTLAKFGKSLTLITLRNPYDLAFVHNATCMIAAWEYTPDIVASIALLLSGKIQATGKLPVRL
ncbi:MAG: glycoside hydrolase family 3 protein [Sphaerochaetaceae bacterium]